VHRGRVGRWLRDLIDTQVTLKCATRIVAVSSDGFRRLSQRTDRAKLRLIHNGIEVPKPPRLSTHDLETERSKQVHVGMVGHLLPYKGWSDFLSVAARVSRAGYNAVWHIIGEGPERGRLEQLSESMGLRDRVCFHGLVHNVHAVLEDLDLFLFTSHREGLSVAVLEAMAHALPVVATDVGGIREQVLEDRNGHVLPVGDIEGLSDRCAELISQPARRHMMGAAGRALLEARFTEASMLESYVALYREVSESHAPRRRAT
ncbi:MAG: glycosyltransferase, partial [Hyphomonadaceae bacterium]|nr:glycosyltransferase [Hyphomonadaceae bacterium]